MKAKWFKHYSDAHEGLSLQTLMDEFKHKGPACYWILVEMCTRKFWEHAEKQPGKDLSEIPCVFRFHRRLLLERLRVGSVVMSRLFHRCNELALFEVREEKNTIEISMPKILEALDRDSKKARKVRANTAPQRTDFREQRTEFPHTPKKQTADAEEDANPDEKNQLVFPGLLKPGGGVSANDLVELSKKASNASPRPGRKANGLTSAKDVISKTGSKGGQP